MFMNEKIQEVRKSLNLSRRDVAMDQGLSEKTIAAIEAGNRIPQYTLLEYLGKKAHISLEYFFNPNFKSLQEWDKIIPANELQEGLREYIDVVRYAKSSNVSPEQLKLSVKFILGITRSTHRSQ